MTSEECECLLFPTYDSSISNVGDGCNDGNNEGNNCEGDDGGEGDSGGGGDNDGRGGYNE